MSRNKYMLLAGGVVLVLALVIVVVGLRGCDGQTVVVQTGEIVICTYGEIVSDTTEDIEVRASEVANHGVTTTVITCEFHEKLAALYALALQAIADGDLEAAERALAEITAGDASYRDASSLLAGVRGRPEADADTPAPAPTPEPEPEPDDAPVGPIANLTDYIPDRLPGFVGQRIYADPFNLFRDYLPESSGEIIQLAAEVEQLQDAAMVERRIDERVKSYYPNDGEALMVGTLDAYFGTRPGFAVIAAGDGAVLVIYEFATTAANPAVHKDTLLTVARAATGQ